MNVNNFPQLRRFAAVSVLILAASAATAQNEAGSAPQSSGESKPSASSDGNKKSAQKAEGGDKAGADDKKKSAAVVKAPSGYATEAEARSHCKTAVVWVDSNHFNHYPGSREYGKKPGAFACE